MRKKNLYGFAVLIIAAVAAFNMNVNSKGNGLSNVSLARVEVLADCEITKKGEVVFSCSGDNTCSDTTLGYTLTCDGTKQ